MVYRDREEPKNRVAVVHLHAEGQTRRLIWKVTPFATEDPLPTMTVDPWSVDLTPGSRVELTQHTRPMSCPFCDGVGRFVCRACGGGARRTETGPRNSVDRSGMALWSPPRSRRASCVCDGGWTPCEPCARVGTVIGTPTIACEPFETTKHRVLDDPRISTELFLALDEAAPRGEIIQSLSWDHPAELAPLDVLSRAASVAVENLRDQLPAARVRIDVTVEAIAMDIAADGTVRWRGRSWPAD
jgi:hypothetical protein